MKLNFRPSKVCFLDFETQSECDLSRSTANKYAKHPSTRVLTCVVKVDDTVHRIGPYLDAAGKELLMQIAAERTVVAHNASFDAAVWEHSAGLPEAEWLDTMPCARAAALPGGLDALGELLTGEGKDPKGKRLIDLLCIVRNGRVPVVGPAHALLMDYNVRDVELLEQVYERVKDYGEPDVMEVDRTVNNRGVPIDVPMVESLIGMFERNKDESLEKFEAMTGGVNPNSPKQVCEWLMRMGFDVKGSVRKQVQKDLMQKPESFFVGEDDGTPMSAAFDVVREAMELRREVARVGGGKALACQQGLEDDGRIRDQFVYYGAHTGRWSGRDLQLHNMPHTVKQVDVRSMPMEYGAAVAMASQASAKAGFKIAVADVLNACLRHMVKADNLLVADYAGVEARGCAWVAGERRMLEVFSDPDANIYIDMGEKVFGRRVSKYADVQEYQLAKSLVLGCGYGMSGAKFEFTCKMRGTRAETLEKMGLSIADCVKVYRDSYPRIPAVWREYGRAAMETVRDGACRRAGRCDFYMEDNHLYLVLPSGRPIVYRNARIEKMVPGWAKFQGITMAPIDTVVFDKARGGMGFLYGSKICENAVQALCRDLLAHAIVECERVGLNPTLHVHDELVCQAEESRLAEMLEIMSVPPAWAEGFPIQIEGYSGPVWTKQSAGFTEGLAVNGRVLKLGK